MRVACKNPEEVAKQFFWLAWSAAGGPVGAGVFQDHPTADANDVFANVEASGDYTRNLNRPGQLYADYVFGRMLKTGLSLDADSVTVDDSRIPRPDYQAWSRKYKSVSDLLAAALDAAGETVAA